MFFHSVDFAVFLPLAFICYWFLTGKNRKGQNLFILLISYFFYGCWDWRFLSLILLSTLVDFSAAWGIAKAERPKLRKLFLGISIGVNLGLLGFFKYYNFFLESFTEVFTFLGLSLGGDSLKIILPVGISFYTFQTLSYTIDVYRRKVNAEPDFIAFAAYVSFFPQLVAGPIERASKFLPQFSRKRSFDYDKAVGGLKQILWGLFKKIVIADNCAAYADLIFNNSGEMSGSTLVLGAVFFAFQIYGDFSGYSDIAIGTARLFGFDLMKNFSYPYFSRDPAEFWRRWHISLSTWFRDYVYVPLGGSRGGTLLRIRNTFIIFVVSGFWHGANLTFIAWGLLNALFFLPLLLAKTNRRNLDIVASDRSLPSLKELFQMLMTFSLMTLAWVFFRAESMSHAFSYLGGIFSSSLFSVPNFEGRAEALNVVVLLLLFLLLEWQGRRYEFALEKLAVSKPAVIRYLIYYGIVGLILFAGGKEQTFIYFQF